MNWIKRELGDFRVLMRDIPSLVICIFTLSVVMMNLLANKELFVTEYVAIDCGTSLSWISFLCMDIICMRFGTKAAAKVSIFAVAVNFICCVIFYLLSLTPGKWGAYYAAAGAASGAAGAAGTTAGVSAMTEATAKAVNDALNSTIGGCWYVVVGSCLAMIIGSLVNSGVFHLVANANANVGSSDVANANKEGIGFKAYALRSYISTLAGQICDNLVFTTIVSHVFFGWSMKQVVICALITAAFELLCEIIFSPLGYRVVRKWEREGVGTSYSERSGAFSDEVSGAVELSAERDE